MLRSSCGVSGSSCSGQKSGYQSMIASAVAFEVDHHDIVVGVDRRADFVEGRAQVADRRQRLVQHRARIVDQYDRTSVGIEAVVEQVARDLHVLAENVLPRVRREADEIQVRHARPLVLEFVERVAEQRLLRGECLLGRRADIARVFGGPTGRFAPPRLMRPEWRSARRRATAPCHPASGARIAAAAASAPSPSRASR